MKVLYWFRRDLRMRDNRGLIEAYSRGDELYAVFVLDEGGATGKTLFNERQLGFVIRLIEDLVKKIPLNIFVGNVEDVFDLLLSSGRIDAVYSITPFSWSEKESVSKVRGICERYGIRYFEVLDNVLSDPRLPHPINNFTSFYRSWQKNLDTHIIESVPMKKFRELEGLSIDELTRKIRTEPLYSEYTDPSWGVKRLSTFRFEMYDESRDYPYIDGVSRLSHFISLGALSIREIYKAASGRSNEFIRQLAWREYYYTLWISNPWMRDLELKPYMRGFKWDNNKYLLESFMEGKTGYPIIDAGIRQLKQEGWIHNRVRLVVANFLVKDLLVDWRIGAEFFRKNLLDYDEVLNIGNWQWAASVGVDPLPLRIFNPIRQSERYDPMCRYIKRYLPELEGYDCKSLHDPLRHRLKGYHEPIVDHYEATRRYVERVKKYMSSYRA